MTRHDVARIGIRIFAVWLGWRGLLAAEETASMMGAYPSSWGGKYWLLTYPALIVIVAVGVWMADDRLARMLLPRVDSSEAVSRWTADDAERVAFVFVGAYLVGLSLSSITYWLVYLPRLMENPSFRATAEMIASVARSAAELIIGLFFVLGARGIVRVIRFAREAGVPHPPSDD